MEESKDLSRRSFIGLGGMAIAGVTAAGLAGCTTPASSGSSTASAASAASSSAASAASSSAASSSAASSTPAGNTGGPAFMTPPAAIADSQIKETVEAELVVVGAGPAGLITAYSAQQAGMDVLVFSSSAAPVSRGGSNLAVYSKKMAEMGLPKLESDPFFRTHMTFAGFNFQTSKWYKFYRSSEEYMNWMIDTMSDTGAVLTVEQGNTVTDTANPAFTHLGSHCWNDEEHKIVADGQPVVVNALAKKIVDGGGQVIFNVTAQQLVRGGYANGRYGRVDAVIGQKEDGSYIKFVGKKAVVLATGDFSVDREMLQTYCPDAVDLIKNWDGAANPDIGKVYGGLYDGQGHKMGLWIGAAWQRSYPNCMMSILSCGQSGRPYMIHSGLVVDANGNRFVNEEIPAGYFGGLVKHLPKAVAFAIWDSEFGNKTQPWFDGKMAIGQAPKTQAELTERWDKSVADGNMFKADTLEELISKLGLPASTIDTVKRYNSLCASGVDEDFLKRKELMTAVDTPPFYGQRTADKPTFLTVLGGLRTNDNMQVCEEDDTPIEGLYNVGSMIGDLYAGNYDFTFSGHNHGMACGTFGYLTGKYIAANE